jgi:hypothetical protein
MSDNLLAQSVAFIPWEIQVVHYECPMPRNQLEQNRRRHLNLIKSICRFNLSDHIHYSTFGIFHFCIVLLFSMAIVAV